MAYEKSNAMKTKRGKAVRIVLMSIITFIVLLFGGFYIYTLDYYRADDLAVTALAPTTVSIEKQNRMTIFYPSPVKDAKTALIFYPGGKVEDLAYTPLLQQLANEGLTCVLVKMPFNLAVFNVNAADAIYDLLPDVNNWYIGGHSLGGAMASSYVGKNSDKLTGLILLGAYPVNDSSIPTLAIYGSEDIKLDLNKLTGVKNHLEIMGGNHAQFGNYGPQKGDGTASISREDQQRQAVEAIMAFITDTKNGITVNMVAPGSTADAGVNPEENRMPVSQITIGRRISTDEVTEAILYFLSEHAGSVTGQFIGVNGGCCV